MKKLYILLLLLSLAGIQNMFAQREVNNWFFGKNAGLTWNTIQDFSATGLFGTPNTTLKRIPTELTGSPMNTHEGCFTLSDSDGRLLAFSDGITLYNRNYEVITSGLGGHASSAQSGIIIPYPGHLNKAVVISLGAEGANNLGFNILNMSLNNGLGGMEGTRVLFTGIPAGSKTSENVTSVRHANKKDYWIVATSKITSGKTYLNAWLVTSSGVQSGNAVTYEIPGLTTNAESSQGYLKFSPDGKHFAWGTWEGKLVYGDFNSSTGAFSNARYIDTNYTRDFYGVEFSLSGKYLYTTGSEQYSPQINGIKVWDFDELLATASPTPALAKKNFHFDEYTQLGALQMAPDGRIYIPANIFQPCIFVIDNPEEDPNSLRLYKLDNLFSAGAYPNIGLPSFVASWFSTNIIGTNEFCMDTDQYFEYRGKIDNIYINTLKNTVWDYGDGITETKPLIISGSNVFFASTTHRYKNRGEYTILVKVLDTDDDEIRDLEQTLHIKVNSCAIPVNHITTHLNNTASRPGCTLPTPPTITFNPSPVNITEGDTFTATITSKAGETYAWSISNSVTNGLSIEGTTKGNSITIRSSIAGTFNANNIKVAATNSCGSTNGYGSGNIVVNGACLVPVTPVIVLNPSPTKVNRNGTFTASISSPESGLSYSWSISDATNNGLTIPGTITGNSITIKATKSGSFDASAINVIATNSCGNTPGQGSGTITVNNCEAAPDPTIAFSPSPVVINQNGTFTATVSVSDPTGVTYKWAISPAGQAQGLSIDASTPDTGTFITIKGATVGTIDANVISVTATNQCGTGTATGSGNITVNDCSPVSRTITFTPSPVVIDINNTFIASISVLPGETVLWSTGNSATNGLLIQGSNNASYVTIKGTKSGSFNASDIKATITNSCGYTEVMGTGTITVNNCVVPNPTITFSPSPVVIESNNNFTATASVSDPTGVTYKWTISTEGISKGLSIVGSDTQASVAIKGGTADIINANVISVTATNSCGSKTTTGSGNITVKAPFSLICNDVYATGYINYDMGTEVIQIPYTMTSGSSYKLLAAEIGTHSGITARVEEQTLDKQTGGYIEVKFSGSTSSRLDKVEFSIKIGGNVCSIYLSTITPPKDCENGTSGKAFVFEQNSKWYVVAIRGKMYGEFAVAETIECNSEEEALRHPEALQYCGDKDEPRCIKLFNRNGTHVGSVYVSGTTEGWTDKITFGNMGCWESIRAYAGSRIEATKYVSGYFGAYKVVGGVGYLGITSDIATLTTKSLR